MKLLPSLANINVCHSIAKVADTCTYRWETDAESKIEDELFQQNEVCASFRCWHKMALHSQKQTYGRAGNGAKPQI